MVTFWGTGGRDFNIQILGGQFYGTVKPKMGFCGGSALKNLPAMQDKNIQPEAFLPGFFFVVVVL